MPQIYLFTIILFLLTNFKHKEKLENSISTTFYTQDSLYKITFDKPIELDTFYHWFDIDDNGCSDEHKYRFSKRNFPPQKETGFYWSSYVDSTYRITLKHVEKFACKNGMDHERMLDASVCLQRIYEFSKMDNPIVNIDTIFSKNKIINHQKFSIYAYKLKEDNRITHDFTNGYWTHYIKAITVIDSNLIVFTADCRIKNPKGFIQRMEKSFETINLERVKRK
ncbi:MAG: hypothetical protein RLZZ175_359 [Bacteroidota bacterium]|jgi:hypothetical protein